MPTDEHASRAADMGYGSGSPSMRRNTVCVDVHCWRLDEEPMVVAQLSQLLTPDELARAERLQVAQHRNRSIVARAGLRLILASALSIQPGGLTFEFSANGRPRLASAAAPDFNLSHSHECAALAVAKQPSGSVGLDIERIRPLNHRAIAGRYFASPEIRAIKSLPTADQQTAFFRCWTRKEAFVKAVGDGLSRPLNTFVVSTCQQARLCEIDGRTEPCRAWRFFEFEPAPGFVGAVACQSTALLDEQRQLVVEVHQWTKLAPPTLCGRV